MAEIKSFTEHTAILVHNVNEDIDGDDVGNLAYTTIGRRGYVAQADTYTATEDDDVIDMDVGATNTVTLPSASTVRLGKTYTIRKITSGNSITINPDGSDTIDSQFTRIVLTRINDYVTLINNYNSTNWSIIGQRGWSDGLLFSNNTTTTVASTASETTIKPSGIGITTTPANFFTSTSYLKLAMQGNISNTGTPSLTIKVKLGGVTITSGAITTASGLSTTGWTLDAILSCQVSGTSGQFWLQGEIRIGANVYPIRANSPHTLNTTTALTLDITAQWGTSSASNTITTQNMMLDFRRNSIA